MVLSWKKCASCPSGGRIGLEAKYRTRTKSPASSDVHQVTPGTELRAAVDTK